MQSLPANVPLKQGLTNIRLLLGIILITCCQTVFAEITLIPEKKAPLPLVSATELDPLTAKTIKQRYPEGFRIFTTNITPLLRKKLKKLATENYNVLFIQPDNRELRQLALSVIQHDGFNTFLVKVFGEQPGCSPFLSREMVEYGTRKKQHPYGS